MAGEHRFISQGESVPTTEPQYVPPRVEAVVTAAELERETLYAGDGSYGIT